VLNADGGRDSTVVARGRRAWKVSRVFTCFNWERILTEIEK